MKKIIIGDGIAGLSASVYAQGCGFDVTILENHSIAGGIVRLGSEVVTCLRMECIGWRVLVRRLP